MFKIKSTRNLKTRQCSRLELFTTGFYLLTPHFYFDRVYIHTILLKKPLSYFPTIGRYFLLPQQFEDKFHMISLYLRCTCVLNKMFSLGVY